IARGAEAAAAYALEPAWFDALGFAAAQLNMVPVVYRYLSGPPDLIFSHLFNVVRWMPDAPIDAPWRGDLFKRLAAALVTPEQYPALRERALAALIASRDRNVLFILRQALRSADPQIRQLACVGLGALGDPEALRDLAPMLDDAQRNVQLAAGLALGAIGTERALEIMVQGLLEGSDELRRAVAEALAAIPDGGHAILRDGILADDIMIRRATVYGLSRVHAAWALVALYRAMMEDEQWYVRTAAEEAFMAARAPEQDGPRAYPEADALPWLIRWAAERGDGVPHGPNARQVLIRALQEGASLERAMAAVTLGQMGYLQALKPLYAALRDRNAEVRAAAFSALAEIQLRTGLPLPTVT
ncbi:MAG: HEAT repeat domain-containing protein, partial [Anaerolineae bacterium]|nr:HEAT repeat domain-containing protein [Anaerolineae bacterium]